jgi:hypothetical protein
MSTQNTNQQVAVAPQQRQLVTAHNGAQFPVYTLQEIEWMARNIANSKSFGVSTPEQAITLCLTAQAKGLHPAIVADRYHFIQGRATMRADAMAAAFIEMGGKIKWKPGTPNENEAEATFSHPSGGEVTVRWDIKKAQRAEIYKEKDRNGGTGMWIKYPEAMLRSRVISDGIRTVGPGVVYGVYTPEEVQDMEQNEPQIPHYEVVVDKPSPASQPTEDFDPKLAIDFNAHSEAANSAAVEKTTGKKSENDPAGESELSKYREMEQNALSIGVSPDKITKLKDGITIGELRVRFLEVKKMHDDRKKINDALSTLPVNNKSRDLWIEADITPEEMDKYLGEEAENV